MNEWRSAAVVIATNKGGGRAKEWGKIEEKKEKQTETERKREMGREREEERDGESKTQELKQGSE